MVSPNVNVAFTIVIKINGRLKEFNFRKRNNGLYDGNTNDEYSIRYYFQLQKEDPGGWQLSGQNLPPWVVNNQPVIVEALEAKIS